MKNLKKYRGGSCPGGKCTKVGGGRCHKNRGGRCHKNGGGKCPGGKCNTTSFSTAKRMVGQDILCKFLVNNVIAYHLWTITSPLIARGGLGIGEYRTPDFCRRRCTYIQIPMLKFACQYSFFLIAHLSLSRNEHIEK